MKLSFIRSVFAASFVLGATLAAAPTYAADEKKDSAAEGKVSAAVGKPLLAAQKAMKDNDFATALAHVKEAQALPDRTPLDDYTINEFLANIAIAQKDYATAATAYEAMADSPALPADKKAATLGNALLLASNANRPENVIRYGEQLQALGPLDPKFSGPLAVAYYNKGDSVHALAIAKQSLDAAAKSGETPNQGILDIVARSQLKTNDFAGATTTLETLVQNFGDPGDWGQLIDIAFQIKGLRDQDALDLYRLRVATDATTPVDDYGYMARVATTLGYPGETVAMLEHGQSKGVVTAGSAPAALLGEARTKEAQDKKTLPAFATLAAAHKTGDYDIKLAETYYGYGRYAETEEVARRAISKGGLKDPSEGPLVLGMALAMQGKNADAVQAFGQVTGSPAQQKIAHLWTVYAQRKYGAAAATPAPAAH